MTSRRSFLTGLAGTIIAAPAIVRAANLMPIKPVVEPMPYLVFGPVDLAEAFDRGMEQLIAEKFWIDPVVLVMGEPQYDYFKRQLTQPFHLRRNRMVPT